MSDIHFHDVVDARGSHFGYGDVHNQFSEARSQESPENEVTVGVITAIPEEYSAVTALLDAHHELPVSDDHTHYVAGSMPPHDVVVTMLTEAGNPNAATACTNLIRSFPTVRYIIMCGIGAGIPAPDSPQRHVRLGDIVVSTWGIVEYDHVDVHPDRIELRPGPPGRRPT